MPRSVLLLVNHDKAEAVEAAREVRWLIHQHGTLVAEDTDNSGPLPPEALSADLAIVLGGDGSLLGQTRRCIAMSDVVKPAVLGINLGKLGFMAEFDLAAFRAQATEILSGRPIAKRQHPLIRTEVFGPTGETRFAGAALNECVITAGPPFRMVELSLSIDKQAGPTVAGDGLIISTPLGSTAYNVSAGGPILTPGVDAVAITPIAAHSLSFRPIVVPLTSEINVSLIRVNEETPGVGTSLILDGQVHHPLHSGETIRISRDARSVSFVRNPANEYWPTLISKLRWAEQPRMRKP